MAADTPRVLPEDEAATLAALWAVYARDGRATVSTVAAAAGRSRTMTYGWLVALAGRGLIAGVGEHTGTVRGALRPLAWPVPLGSPPRGNFCGSGVRVPSTSSG